MEVNKDVNMLDEDRLSKVTGGTAEEELKESLSFLEQMCEKVSETCQDQTIREGNFSQYGGAKERSETG